MTTVNLPVPEALSSPTMEHRGEGGASVGEPSTGETNVEVIGDWEEDGHDDIERDELVLQRDMFDNGSANENGDRLDQAQNLVSQHGKESHRDASEETAVETLGEKPVPRTFIVFPLDVVSAGADEQEQCFTLAKRFGLVHLVVRDIVRSNVKRRSELGVLVSRCQEEGVPIPAPALVEMIEQRMREEDCLAQGWLLESFPRTEEDTQVFASSGIVVDRAVVFNTSQQAYWQRYAGLRTDPETGAVYHLESNPPPQDEALLARLEQPPALTEEELVRRIQAYEDDTKAVREQFRDLLTALPMHAENASDGVEKEALDSSSAAGGDDEGGGGEQTPEDLAEEQSGKQDPLQPHDETSAGQPAASAEEKPAPAAATADADAARTAVATAAGDDAGRAEGESSGAAVAQTVEEGAAAAEDGALGAGDGVEEAFPLWPMRMLADLLIDFGLELQPEEDPPPELIAVSPASLCFTPAQVPFSSSTSITVESLYEEGPLLVSLMLQSDFLSFSLPPPPSPLLALTPAASRRGVTDGEETEGDDVVQGDAGEMGGSNAGSAAPDKGDVEVGEEKTEDVATTGEQGNGASRTAPQGVLPGESEKSEEASDKVEDVVLRGDSEVQWEGMRAALELAVLLAGMDEEVEGLGTWADAKKAEEAMRMAEGTGGDGDAALRSTRVELDRLFSADSAVGGAEPVRVEGSTAATEGLPVTRSPSEDSFARLAGKAVPGAPGTFGHRLLKAESRHTEFELFPSESATFEIIFTPDCMEVDGGAEFRGAVVASCEAGYAAAKRDEESAYIMGAAERNAALAAAAEELERISSEAAADEGGEAEEEFDFATLIPDIRQKVCVEWEGRGVYGSVHHAACTAIQRRARGVQARGRVRERRLALDAAWRGLFSIEGLREVAVGTEWVELQWTVKVGVEQTAREREGEAQAGRSGGTGGRRTGHRKQHGITTFRLGGLASISHRQGVTKAEGGGYDLLKSMRRKSEIERELFSPEELASLLRSFQPPSPAPEAVPEAEGDRRVHAAFEFCVNGAPLPLRVPWTEVCDADFDVSEYWPDPRAGEFRTVTATYRLSGFQPGEHVRVTTRLVSTAPEGMQSAAMTLRFCPRRGSMYDVRPVCETAGGEREALEAGFGGEGEGGEGGAAGRGGGEEPGRPLCGPAPLETAWTEARDVWTKTVETGRLAMLRALIVEEAVDLKDAAEERRVEEEAKAAAEEQRRVEAILGTTRKPGSRSGTRRGGTAKLSEIKTWKKKYNGGEYKCVDWKKYRMRQARDTFDAYLQSLQKERPGITDPAADIFSRGPSYDMFSRRPSADVLPMLPPPAPSSLASTRPPRDALASSGSLSQALEAGRRASHGGADLIGGGTAARASLSGPRLDLMRPSTAAKSDRATTPGLARHDVLPPAVLQAALRTMGVDFPEDQVRRLVEEWTGDEAAGVDFDGFCWMMDLRTVRRPKKSALLLSSRPSRGTSAASSRPSTGGSALSAHSGSGSTGTGTSRGGLRGGRVEEEGGEEAEEGGADVAMAQLEAVAALRTTQGSRWNLAGVGLGHGKPTQGSSGMATSESGELVPCAAAEPRVARMVELLCAAPASASVRVLLLYDNQIADAAATVLAGALGGGACVEKLSLRSNMVGDHGAVALAAAMEGDVHLTELDLSINQVQDVGAEALGKVLASPSCRLKTLHLDRNRIADPGATGLAEGLGRNASLVELGLERNAIEDGGMSRLQHCFESLNSTVVKARAAHNPAHPAILQRLLKACAEHIAPPRHVKYKVSPAVYAYRSPVRHNFAFCDGTRPLYWTVDPPLPPGLALDQTDGCIHGTPLMFYPRTVHTVVASNPAGECSTSLALEVRSGANVLPLAECYRTDDAKDKFRTAFGFVDRSLAGHLSLDQVRQALRNIGVDSAALPDMVQMLLDWPVPAGQGSEALPEDLVLDVDQFAYVGQALSAEHPEIVPRPVRKGPAPRSRKAQNA